MSERGKSWCWAALLAAVVLWFFHEAVFCGYSLVPTDLLHNLMLPYAHTNQNVQVTNHYAMDALTTDYPLGVFWQQSVQRDGELPLWNPHILGGHPNLADSMPAVLSPFKLLYLVCDGERAFTLGVVLEFLLAGLFMFALLRELGRSHAASFVGGCGWALNSMFVMWYWRAPGVFCWAPLVLLLLERAARRGSWGLTGLAGVVLGGALLGGNIQAGGHLGFLCTAYAAGMVWWREPSQRGRMFALAAVALLIGVAVAAVQWLPALELMARDATGGTQARGARAGWQHTLLGLPGLITFLFPAATGSTETFDLLKLAKASRGDFTGYIGAVPFALFVIGAGMAREWRVRAARLTLAAVLALVFFTPALKYLYHRFFVVAVFLLAVLAAYGADMVLDPSTTNDRRIRRVWIALGWLCGVMAAGLLAGQVVMLVNGDKVMAVAQRFVADESSKYAFANRPDWFAERVRRFFEHYRLGNVEFWLPLAALPAAGTAWWAYRRGRLSRMGLAGTLVVLTVADLTVLGRRWMPQCDLKQYPLTVSSPVLQPLAKETDLFRVHRWGPYAGYIFRPNLLMAYGLDDLWGNFSLAPETVERLPFQTNGQFNALLDLANVKYLITGDSYDLPAPRFELMTEADGARLYRNPRCLPRLQFVSHWQVETNRQRMRELMVADSFDPRKTVFLEETPPLPATVTDAPAVLALERYSSGRVVATVTAPHAGLLLLADTWYPGWRARVDGQPAPCYRADLSLRATVVPAGQHRVEFRYEPGSVRAGAVIALAGLIAGVGLYLRCIPRMLTKKLDKAV